MLSRRAEPFRGPTDRRISLKLNLAASRKLALAVRRTGSGSKSKLILAAVRLAAEDFRISTTGDEIVPTRASKSRRATLGDLIGAV